MAWLVCNNTPKPRSSRKANMQKITFKKGNATAGHLPLFQRLGVCICILVGEKKEEKGIDAGQGGKVCRRHVACGKSYRIFMGLFSSVVLWESAIVNTA